MVFGPILRPHIKSLLSSYALYIALTLTVNHFYKKSLSKYAFKTNGLSLENMDERIVNLSKESKDKCIYGTETNLFTESASFTDNIYFIDIKLHENVTSCRCTTNCFVAYDKSQNINNRGCDFATSGNGTFTGWLSGHVIFNCGKYSNYMDGRRLGLYLSQFTFTKLLVNFSKWLSYCISVIILILGFMAPCMSGAENKSGLGRRLSAYNIQKENTENSLQTARSNEAMKLAGEILTNKSRYNKEEENISKMMRNSEGDKRNTSKTSRRSNRRGSVIETKDILRQMKESRIDRHVLRNRNESFKDSSAAEEV